MNYLELVESFSFGFTASWKVQDEREEYIFFFFSLAQLHSGTFPQGCLGPFSSAAKFTFLLGEFSWNIKLQGWRQASSKQCDQQLIPPGSVCTSEPGNSFSWQCWDHCSLAWGSSIS